MSRSPYTPEFRAMIVKKYLDGDDSYHKLSSEYGIADNTIKRWVWKYKAHGMEALEDHPRDKAYSSEIKYKCVESYYNGEMSTEEIAVYYNISSPSVVDQWVKLYNANKELMDYDPKGEVYMAEAKRKTTKEERLEIVRYCLDHDRDYKGTASKYNVSYSQVYSWVKKYDSNGEKELTDRRGRHKTDDEVDEMEKLRRENVRLKGQLKEKDMTIELLKKVKEYEGK